MMEENISERSGFVRLALGTGLTACGIAHLAKESGNRTLGSIFVAAGAMKIAEGIFLYCPTKALINSNVREAVATTFDEFLDGDSLMNAYNQAYNNKWSGGSSQSGSNSSNSSTGQNNSTMKNVANTASQVAQTVSNVAPSGTMVKSASQAIKTAADTVSGTQSQQNKNKSNNSSQSGQSS
ncbi:hypothetical protein MKY04_19250 [Lysinibacillus telephonicus]|uniref:hypothetical protein n=1 Tax=Lysinibacillus telephonicus TaxID=1714840 RepID=UPI0031FCC79E